MNNFYFRYAPYNYKKYFDVFSHLFHFHLLSFTISALFIKLVNHVYHMWTSLTIIYGIYTSPTLTTISLMHTKWFSLEWFRSVLFDSQVPQFALMTISDLKTMINYIPSAVLRYVAVEGISWFGIYDYRTLLLKTNAKIAEINAEMEVFVHHRNLTLHTIALLAIIYVLCRGRKVTPDETQSENERLNDVLNV